MEMQQIILVCYAVGNLTAFHILYFNLNREDEKKKIAVHISHIIILNVISLENE